jgi:hypothetical protein
MDSPTLRALIQSTLKPLNLWSANAEELLLATCAQESLMGVYRTQGNGGPARGIFQMEGEDHDDIWQNYLSYHADLGQSLHTLAEGNPVTDEMVNNDPYAIAMARVHYMRAPGSLPAPTDLNGLWTYYKQHYNTPGGAATQEQFNEHYKRFVTDGVAS